MKITIEDIQNYIESISNLTIIDQDDDIIRISIDHTFFNIKKSDLLTFIREYRLTKILN